MHQVFALLADPLHRADVEMKHEDAMQFFVGHHGALDQNTPANALVEVVQKPLAKFI